MTKEIFIKSLISGLKIEVENNPFEYQAVVDSVENIKESQYMDFYNDCRSEKAYGDGMSVLKAISAKYQNMNTDNLVKGSRGLAKEMYNKFYEEHCAMTDFTQKHREAYPHDREFFRKTNYAKLKKTDGSSTYTKQEVFVLNELGGGDWLLDIKHLTNSATAIDKIEYIIKNAIFTKYSNAIEYKKPSKAIYHILPQCNMV